MIFKRVMFVIPAQQFYYPDFPQAGIGYLSELLLKHNIDNSVIDMEMALKHGPIKQCISDHGSEFTSNFIDANSRFRDYLKENNIKQILCRIKHPQSNGKIEKWFECYDKHRKAFKNKDDFIVWYNDVRPHRALNFEEHETPSQAFIRKRRK